MALAEGSGVIGAPPVKQYFPPPPKAAALPTVAPPTTQPTSIADYIAMLTSDPIYQRTVAEDRAASIADASQIGQGILNALVQRGTVPNLDAVAQKLGLSPAIVNWIKSNVNLGLAKTLAGNANSSGVSEQAQLDQAHQAALGNIKDALAARGMVRSGATPFLTGQEEHNYTKSVYDADKALSDYINGAYSAFTKSEQGRSTDLTNALSDAYQRALQALGPSIPASTMTPATASSPAASSVSTPTVGPGILKAVRAGNIPHHLAAGI